MWILNKPNISIATGKDIDELVAHCQVLSDSDKAVLKTLYVNYDRQGGSVSSVQLDTINSDKANAIHGQYEKTHKGKNLNYIRNALNLGIDLCPHCSINQVSNLDHFMPRSAHKALSVCRLNLVPTCSVCNEKKKDGNYKDFVHAYYDTFPTQPFLIANIIIVRDRIVIRFHFDSAAINDRILENKLNCQAVRIELWDRLLKSSNSFINDLFNNCQVSDTKQLKVWLNHRLLYYRNNYGLNDWRTAIVRGLINCPHLTMSTVNNLRKIPPKINNGAGA